MCILYLELPGSSVLRGVYFRLGFRSEVLANSITGPPPPPPLELVEGDKLDGTLTLFNASLYFLNINVRFLVAITKLSRQNLISLFLLRIEDWWIWWCCGGHVIGIGGDGGGHVTGEIGNVLGGSGGWG